MDNTPTNTSDIEKTQKIFCKIYNKGTYNHNEIIPQTCYTAYDKKTKDKKFWKGHREKGTLTHCW